MKVWYNVPRRSRRNYLPRPAHGPGPLTGNSKSVSRIAMSSQSSGVPDSSHDSPMFCDRCMLQLRAGKGDFYVVHIEAYADPSPPTFDEQSLGKDLKSEINQLVAQLSDVSERESLDQVYRRVTIYLCVNCYRPWIENPAG